MVYHRSLLRVIFFAQTPAQNLRFPTSAEFRRAAGFINAPPAAMPKVTLSKAVLPKKPPKVREVKDAALMAARIAECTSG